MAPEPFPADASRLKYVLCGVAPEDQFAQNTLIIRTDHVNLLRLLCFRCQFHQAALYAGLYRFVYVELLEYHDVIVAFHHVPDFIIPLRQ